MLNEIDSYGPDCTPQSLLLHSDNVLPVNKHILVDLGRLLLVSLGIIFLLQIWLCICMMFQARRLRRGTQYRQLNLPSMESCRLEISDRKSRLSDEEHKEDYRQ